MTERRYRLAAQELAAYEAANLAAAEAEGPDWVPPTPRPAAGVILARDSDSGPQVLLVRRRSDMGFAAGAFVFPGGTLDEDDASERWADHLEPPPPGALAGAVGPDGQPERAFLVAALRELFEETGVLLAKGELPEHEELVDQRGELVSGQKSFFDIVTGRGLHLAGEHVALCARWITPEALPRRYDARFFIAESPPNAQVAPELGELVEHVWVGPADALARYVEDAFPMMFPTAVTLGWLEGETSVDALLARFNEASIAPILPRLRRVDGEVRSVLPDEPEYGEGTDADAAR